MMNEIKLKPCPFCGGEAEFYRTPIKTNGAWCDSVVVRCKNNKETKFCPNCGSKMDLEQILKEGVKNGDE